MHKFHGIANKRLISLGGFPTLDACKENGGLPVKVLHMLSLWCIMMELHSAMIQFLSGYGGAIVKKDVQRSEDCGTSSILQLPTWSPKSAK